MRGMMCMHSISKSRCALPKQYKLSQVPTPLVSRHCLTYVCNRYITPRNTVPGFTVTITKVRSARVGVAVNPVQLRLGVI